MKKIIFIMLFSSSAIFANTNVENLKERVTISQNSETAAPDCKIIEKNTYNYCLNHGFTKKDAADIAKAAAEQCEKVK